VLIAPVLVKPVRLNVPVFGGPLEGDAPVVKLEPTVKLIVPELLLFGKGMPVMSPPPLLVVNVITPGADQTALPLAPALETLSDGAVGGQLKNELVHSMTTWLLSGLVSSVQSNTGYAGNRYFSLGTQLVAVIHTVSLHCTFTVYEFKHGLGFRVSTGTPFTYTV